jgi:hypothetical protein
MAFKVKKSTNSRISNRDGSALILTLPLIIVVAASVEMVFNQTISFNNTVKAYRVTAVRNNIVKNMNLYSSMPSTFRSSVNPSLGSQVNPELQNCLFGSATPQCIAGQSYPVTLYAPVSSNALSSSGSLQVIAGTMDASGNPTSNPALYDVHGSPCAVPGSAATAQCPFEVYARFNPTCASGAICSVADSVTATFMVRAPNLIKNLVFKSITQTASKVVVQNILPPTASAYASSTNQVITGHIDVFGSTPTPGTVVTSGLTLADIEAAVRAGGVSDQVQVTALAQDFINAGYYTDVGFITSVTSAALQSPYVGMGKYADLLPALIVYLAMNKVVDTPTAAFLTAAGVTDPNWMKFLMDSGVRDVFYANTEYDNAARFSSPFIFGQAVNAANAAAIPHDTISIAIIGTNVTDPVRDLQLYTIMSAVSDPFVAAGMILGNQTAPAQITGIVSAVNGLNPAYTYGSMYGMGLAQIGITDYAKAHSLAAIVSVIENPYWARDLVIKGGGDAVYTQHLVDTFQPPTNETPILPTVTLPWMTAVTGGTPGTPSSTGSPGSAGGTPVATGADIPAVGGALSACTNCAILTF